MKHKLIFISILTIFIFKNSVLTAWSEAMKPAEEMFRDTKYTEEKYYKTERVLLSATKNLMESRKAPAINTVITAEEIRNMGARNIFDVLNRIPGLSISWNQIKGLINVRGVQTDHSEKILLMIDGMSINDSNTGSPTFYFGEDMMIENIKRIEVVRGPGSALFGANAFIGVINIITKEPEDYNSDEVYLSHSSFGTNSHTVLFSNTKTDLKVSAHFNYFDTDGERPTIDEDLASVKGIPGSLAPGKAQGFDEKYDFGLKLRYNDFSFNSRIMDKERGAFAGVAGALNDESKIDVTLVLTDLTYNKNITDDFNLSLKLYARHYDMDNYFEMFSEGFTGTTDKGYIGNPSAKNITSGCELTTNVKRGDHLITGGLVYENDRQYNVTSINNFDDPLSAPIDTSSTKNFNKNVSRQIGAAFIQEMWEITAYDSLTLGLRFDYYDDCGGTTNPRMAYVHEFKNEMIVKLLYGSAFRAPAYNELYVINNSAVEGNTDLEPETIQSFETSFEVPMFKHFNLNINYFYNIIEDLIRVDVGKYKNISKDSEMQGVEAELTCHFGKNRYGYVNTSYQDSEDTDGHKLPYVAEWMGNAGYNHEFFNFLNANLHISWIGERTRSTSDPRTDNPDPATLVDLTLIARNFNKTIEIKASVFNMFNEDFVAPSTTLTNMPGTDTIVAAIPNDLPLHERMFLFELMCKF
ncbi:MAG: TonB-dependent receptor [Proteobacteria bacterium]|nr:TonB-dependent receptor [Pseudomonadota bacterium]